MAFYQFKRTQLVRASLEELWDFISSPANLSRITPEKMGFKISSGDLPDKMYPGMIISYRVKPLPIFSTTWVTEITHVSELKYFVDEQRVGPYAMWHHEHILEPQEQGILMTDIVSYVPPMGLLGRIANRLIIKNRLKHIFDFRTQALNQIFTDRHA